MSAAVSAAYPQPWDAVLDEARRLAASGVRELNLIAEDTNQYGMDLKAG